MNASVDKNSCIGCGLCAELCPTVFEMDVAAGTLIILNPVPSDGTDTCREADESCPLGAIALTT